MIAFAILFALGIIVWFRSNPGEPVYHGKSLRDWTEQFGTNWTGNSAPTGEARAAIKAMGPKTVPFLLDWLRMRESALKKKLPARFVRQWPFLKRFQDNSGNLRRNGAHGIAALGADTPPEVLPQLIEIARNHPDEDGQYIAGFALRTLGPAGQRAIPFFIERLTNSQNIVRDDAAIALGGVEGDPAVVVPPLVRYLEFATNSPSSFEAVDTIWALRHYGTNASAAGPLLLSLLHHPREEIRVSVTNCLPDIDPERAKKAGLRGTR